MSSKYINGNEQLGLKYDWRKIFKEYERLGCPKDVYSPLFALRQGCSYNVAISERSTGKTTNWILLGLCMHKLYGTIIQYIRQSENMIMPKNIGKMMSVINQCGYCEKLTDGKYNMLEYKARNWYYIKTDELGNTIEKSEPVMFCLDLDHNEYYKSSYNAPLGDLIIFDEFVSQRYRPNEFVLFCDLVKTIIRERLSPVIVMLANTTDRYNTYFQELDIQQELLGLKIGEHFKKDVGGSTSVFCELVGSRNEQRATQNSKFFRFKNPRLSSITGGDWAIDSYPHIEREESSTLLQGRVIRFNSALVGLELCTNDRLGLHVKAHRITKTYPENIIYTIENINEMHERYRFGWSRVDSILWELYDRNKWYYSTNEVGNIVGSYVRQAKGLCS